MAAETRRPLFNQITLIVGYFILGAALLAVASLLPVNRTQEARVIVTAEEMVDQPLNDWLIPKMNGEVRLRKPPLAYWLSAISMDVFGPSDLAARAPAVLASWATLGLTFLIALRLFNPRVALFAAMTLFGSRLFFKQAALAETDNLVCAFMTASTWCGLLIADAQNRGRAQRERWLLMLLALLVAATVLAKGPQALLILLALVGFDVVRHRIGERSIGRGITSRFFITGAFVITLLLALPWFIYVIGQTGSEQLAGDLSNSAGGGLGHSGGIFTYFKLLPVALLPWTVVWLFALWMTVIVLRRSPEDPIQSHDVAGEHRSLWLLLAWGLAVFVPLLAWGNKQIHYLLPLMPATMISVGWMLDRALRFRNDPASWFVNGYIIALLVISALIAPLLPIAAMKIRPHSEPIDYVIASIIAVAVIVALMRARRGSAGTLTGIATLMSAMLFFLLGACWAPTLNEVNSYTITMDLRNKFPNADFVFRDEPSLAMVAAFDRVIPVLTEEQLAERATNPKMNPRLICLDTDPLSTDAPANFHEIDRIVDDDDTVVVYAARGSVWDDVP